MVMVFLSDLRWLVRKVVLGHQVMNQNKYCGKD